MTTFVALDFETANRDRSSACALGLVRVEGGVITRRVYMLIRPPTNLFIFTPIHGITWSQVANQPTFGEHWPRVAELLQGVDFVVAHCVGFDRSVLARSCAAYEITPPPLRWEDTFQVARRRVGLANYQLPTVCAAMGVRLAAHHHAGHDALAAANLALAFGMGGARAA